MLGKRTLLMAPVTVLSLLALALVPASPAAASTTLSVTTTADSNPASGPCASGSTTPPSPLSLRDALCVASNLGGAVTVSVPAGTYDLSFGQLQAGLNSGDNVTIDGAGAASTTINAQGQTGVISFDENLVGGVDGTVSGLTITGGSDSTFGGAGIIAGSGNASTPDDLTVEDSVITGNNADQATPAVTNNFGGGIQFIGGALTITDSTISDNTSASSDGAAVYYQAEGAASPESFTMSGSTITGNSEVNTQNVVPTDGVVDVGASSSSVPMSITSSTFTDNTLTGKDGPVLGAALALESGAVKVTDSDFAQNSVTNQAGTNGSGGGAIAAVGGSATITDDRIVGNQVSGASGEGIDNAGGTVTATNDWWERLVGLQRGARLVRLRHGGRLGHDLA
jgi:hypothetical protein